MTGPTAGRWMKLHDSLINGHALALSRDARLLGVEAEAWSDIQETDGYIPSNALRRITDAEDPLEPIVAELVDAGRWIEADGGWQVVGFTERHGDAATRAADRAENNARQRGYQRHVRGSHNADGPRSCAKCEAVRNGVTHNVRTVVRNDVDDTRRYATSKDRKKARSAPSGLRPSVASLADAVAFVTTRFERPAILDPRYNAVTAELDAAQGGGDEDPYTLCAVCGVPIDGLDLVETVEVTIGDADGYSHASCASDPSVRPS